MCDKQLYIQNTDVRGAMCAPLRYRLLAAELRIEVPKLPVTADFDKIDPADIKKAFDSVQTLVDFAGMVADAHSVCAIKKSDNQ